MKTIIGAICIAIPFTLFSKLTLDFIYIYTKNFPDPLDFIFTGGLFMFMMMLLMIGIILINSKIDEKQTNKNYE